MNEQTRAQIEYNTVVQAAVIDYRDARRLIAFAGAYNLEALKRYVEQDRLGELTDHAAPIDTSVLESIQCDYHVN